MEFIATNGGNKLYNQFFWKDNLFWIPQQNTYPSTLKKWKEFHFLSIFRVLSTLSLHGMYDVRPPAVRKPRSIDRAQLHNQEEMMEVEGLDGATASLIFFVVVAILVFGCLQVVVVGGGVGLGGVQVFGWRPREVRVRWYDGYGMVCHFQCFELWIP